MIIPVLNEARRLPLAVESAWAAGGDEVVVCDGGSDDGSLELAGELPCRLVNSAAGRATQLNAAAQVAQGELLLFLHADNWLGPETIQQLRQAAARGAKCGAFRQQIDSPEWIYRWLEWGNAARVRWRGLPYGDQGIFVDRQLFHSVGGFPTVRLMEDLLLMRRLRRLTRPVLLAGPLHVDARRWQRHGVVRQTLRNWMLLTARSCGVHPDRLADFYRRHDRR